MYPDSTLLLDASSNLADIMADEKLTFTWSCLRTKPYVGPCDGITLSNNLDTMGRGVNVPSILSIVTGDETVCEAGSITVTLAVGSSVVFETAYSDVTIVIISKNTPIIESLINSNIKSNGVSKINVGDKLQISGVISIPVNASVTWNISDSINLNTASLTPTSVFMYRTKASTVSLLLKPNSLPQGASLTITLTCKSTTRTTRSSIVVNTNSPPSDGSFIVDPTTGVELRDLFSMSASLWTDEDYPLSYEFLYYFNSTRTSSSSTLVLRSRTQIPSAMVYLSANSMNATSIAIIIAKVYDGLDAYTTLSLPVTVCTQQLSPVEYGNLIGTSVNSLKSRADPLDTDGIAQLTTMMNRYYYYYHYYYYYYYYYYYLHTVTNIMTT